MGKPWLLCYAEASLPFPKYLYYMCLGWLAAFVVFTPETTGGTQNCCEKAWVGGVGKEDCFQSAGGECFTHRELALMTRIILGCLLSQCLLMKIMPKIIKIIQPSHLSLTFCVTFLWIEACFLTVSNLWGWHWLSRFIWVINELIAFLPAFFMTFWPNSSFLQCKVRLAFFLLIKWRPSEWTSAFCHLISNEIKTWTFP